VATVAPDVLKKNDKFEGWFQLRVRRHVRDITEAIADDARAGCPVDSGDLVSTIRTFYPGGQTGVVIVGGEAPNLLATNVNYWAAVEYGSRPHVIESHGPWPLRNHETGEVFGRVVNHPGTRAQPFMRPAMYKRRKLRRIA
jgi:HK97 gp10 family phage protein